MSQHPFLDAYMEKVAKVEPMKALQKAFRTGASAQDLGEAALKGQGAITQGLMRGAHFAGKNPLAAMGITAGTGAALGAGSALGANQAMDDPGLVEGLARRFSI